LNLFYYPSVAFIDVILVLVISGKLNAMVKALAIFITMVGIFVVTLLNYSMSMIPREANRFYPKLNSLIAKNGLHLKMKLKVCSLIEKISGPVIGLYCFEFFPFTNYEFYLFAVNCVMNFILFMGLLK